MVYAWVCVHVCICVLVFAYVYFMCMCVSIYVFACMCLCVETFGDFEGSFWLKKGKLFKEEMHHKGDVLYRK